MSDSAHALARAAGNRQLAAMGGGSGLSEQDLYLFNEGSHVRLFEKLGSHPDVFDGRAGTRFAVWAPNAEAVHVVGDWNG